MPDFKQLLGEMGDRVARGLGLRPTDRERLHKLRAELETSKAINVDRWEQIKDDIRKLELRLKKLKAEYESSHGLVKEMVGQQIEAAFGEMDRKKQGIALVRRNIENLATAMDRIDELLHAKASGVSEESLDDLAIQLEEGFADARQTDKAMAELNDVAYKAPESEPMDISGRLSELDQSVASSPGLSEGTAERLKRLEKEMEG